MIKNLNNKIFLSFIIIIVINYIFFTQRIIFRNNPYITADWLINYQGGFTRRGLMGEIIFQISQFFDFQLRKIFLISQITIYIGYFYSIYLLFKKIEFHYFFALAIFSPLFFIFSLSELEALGRKDILLFLVFILNFIIFFKFEKLK